MPQVKRALLAFGQPIMLPDSRPDFDTPEKDFR
jgi:hypothetical protein